MKIIFREPKACAYCGEIRMMTARQKYCTPQCGKRASNSRSVYGKARAALVALRATTRPDRAVRRAATLASTPEIHTDAGLLRENALTGKAAATRQAKEGEV